MFLIIWNAIGCFLFISIMLIVNGLIRERKSEQAELPPDSMKTLYEERRCS